MSPILRHVLTSVILAQLSLVFGAPSLIPRKRFDPYIVCQGDVPGPAAGWPANYGPNNYTSNMDLCSGANGIPHINVGCICTTSQGQLHCDEDVADPNLYYKQMTLFDTTFPSFCMHACECATEDDAADLADNNAMLASVDIPSLNVPSPWDTAAPLNTAASSMTEMSPIEATYQNQCGNNCTTAADCSPDGGCSCSAQSSTFVPGAGYGAGTMKYVATCLISLGGKRDEGFPCPCNSTYVSHACCGATDGLVWEGPQAKLGELALSDEP
ncbi:MAG: hypothetical protein M4579_003400 [Chaenotheca gracillima]|nr:MAG: hypothetical protein M4579_003400 [Chaenotheca gracillima]